MKHLVYFLLSWTAWGGLEASAQLCKVEGNVSDAISGEALIGAYIKVGDQVVATDFDGGFDIDLPRGVVELEVSYIGYESQRREVNCDGATTFVSFALETLLMKEAIVATDIAIDRKTPVAFTNVLPAQIQEELAGRDLPMVLNTTPGVYATQQGGGDGDARVTIRGFDQTNLAVMVDGVPMNDMETGQVYWSNWSGLDLVVKTFQVQRGLGASKLALPAVGGTMNILTGGNENANGELNYQSEIGSYGYMRNSISGVFGSQDKGFLHVAGSCKTNEGFANGLFSEAWAYYVKGTKTSGRHRLSLTAFGAPQRHGQRSYTAPIHHYSMAMAQDLYQDSVYAQLETEIQDQPDLVASDFGFDFNPFVLNYSDNEYVAGDSLGNHPEYGPAYEIADTIPGNSVSRTSRLNFYHKPIVTLRDFFRINDRVSLVTTAYASFGTGGGMRLDGGARATESDVIGGGGEIDYQRLYDANEGIFNINNAQFLASPFGVSQASGWLASSYNNHRWWGGLSTLTAEATEHMTVSAGVDVRRYVGIHYRAVEDFVGGDLAAVALEDRNHNMPYDSPLGIGDKYLYHDEGHVAWGGGFGQVEWDHYNWSAFANVSVAKSWYKGIDFFRPKVLEIDGVTYEVNSESRGGVLGSFDYDIPSILAEDTTNFQNDLVFVDGEQILASDSRLQTYETPWIQLSGFTLKGGGSYLVHENLSVFGNMGYLSKAPQFNSVIDIGNDIIDGYKNQFVKAVELGAKFTSARFSSNLNIYRTGWENRAVNRFMSFADLVTKPKYSSYNTGLDEENARDYGFILLTVDALHRGFEWDFSYEPTPKLDLEGVLSLGDWRWANNPIVDFINRNDPTETITFSETGLPAFDTLRIDGLPVGNAAQTQLGMSLTYRPIPGSYVRLRMTQFSDQWADFAPQDAIVSDGIETRDPWKMPNYNLLDFMAGTRIDISDNADVTLRLMVTNVLNQRVITDARGNDAYGWTSSSPDIYQMGLFNASRATVFVGPPRMVRLSAVLGLKGLQNRKPKE